MKECKKCHVSKVLDDFYNRDNTCKECRKKAVRSNRIANLDYYREYDRKRGNRHGPGYLKKYRKQNAIKQQAHNRVNHAVIDGRLVKPDSCEECGDDRFGLHAHHDDYAKQLEVRWLCPGCHHQWHAKHGEANNADMEPLPRGQFVAINRSSYDNALSIKS